MTANITITKLYAGDYKVFVDGTRIGAIVDAANGTGLWYFDADRELGFNSNISAKGFRRVKNDVVAEIKNHLWSFENVWNRVAI